MVRLLPVLTGKILIKRERVGKNLKTSRKVKQVPRPHSREQLVGGGAAGGGVEGGSIGGGEDGGGSTGGGGLGGRACTQQPSQSHPKKVTS